MWLTNLDKQLYPSGFTKVEVVDYRAWITTVMAKAALPGKIFVD